MNFDVITSKSKPLSLNLYWQIAIPTTFTVIILPLVVGPTFRFYKRHSVGGIFFLYGVLFILALVSTSLSGTSGFNTLSPFWFVAMPSISIIYENAFALGQFYISRWYEKHWQREISCPKLAYARRKELFYSLLVYLISDGIGLYICICKYEYPGIELSYILPFYGWYFYLLLKLQRGIDGIME